MINKFTSHISRISPELNKLKEIAKETMEENIVHTIEVLESKEPLPKLIGRELGQMVVQGPSRIVEKVEKVSEPMRSIAEKTVEILAEEKSPIAQTFSEIIKECPSVNPVNVVNQTEEAVKTYTKVVSESADEIGKEMTKTIIKEKVNIAVKKSFLSKIFDFFKKIKNFFIKKEVKS